MDYQNFSQENEPAQVKRPNAFWAIIATAIMATLLSNGGVYLLQTRKMKALESQLNTVTQKLSLLAAKSVINTQTTQNTTVISSSANDETTPSITTTGTKFYQDSINKVSFSYPKNSWYLHTQTLEQYGDLSQISSVILTNNKELTTKPTEGFANGLQINFSIAKMRDEKGTAINQQQYIEKYINPTFENKITTSTVIINNKQFLKKIADATMAQQNFLEYFYFKDNIVYIFTLWPYDDSKPSQAYNDLQAILKTFSVQ